MKCPFCGFSESKVIDSRPTDEGEKIRRRRECVSCSKRFTTYEIIESVPIIVVKKDKSREAFDRVKLFNGMLRACEKRPVSISQIENAVADIEAELQNSLDREVTSVHIGELAMDRLKLLDEVAYVRCLGLPSVQGYQHIHGGACKAAEGKIIIKRIQRRLKSKKAIIHKHPKRKALCEL